MTTLLNIPSLTIEKQRRASDPAASVWVSANAGSGKTHVLTQRVVRLLLEGSSPSKILCLTFTKAAAANMAARVFNTLAAWTRLDDASLDAAIIATGAPKPSARERTAARKLFARAVETPGGLKIQTIHAFCERVLHLFPFEANTPSRFVVADEAGQAELLQRARRETLEAARRDEDGLARNSLGESLLRVSGVCSGFAFEKLIGEAMRLRAVLREAWPRDHAASLARALALPPGRDCAAIRTEMIADGLLSGRAGELAAFLDTPAAKDQDRKKAALLREAAALLAAGERDACLDAYLPAFFNADGARTKKLLTKALAEARPDIAEDMAREQERLDRLGEELKAAAACERTLALARLTDAVFMRYAAIKSMRGVLDFDDLVGKTLSLLERSEAAWVLYKLDAGVDHILVDEAQDTSAAQWRILELLAGEFTVGEGRRGPRRTFFAVGDEKQSIFSFQGAAPQMFDEMRRSFETRFGAAAEKFAHVRLTHSFRSSPGVLAAVDKVFAAPGHQSGLVAQADGWMPHEAVKTKLPALVEIWPPLGAGDAPTARDWRLPLDILDEAEPANVVAGRVAQKIASLIADPAETVRAGAPGAARRIGAGDVLVLVRTRGPFFEAVIRALKRNGVPVAGADRLKISEHIAVLDLVAAGRVALLPQDDLTLAAVLKSPLVGLDDDDLLSLAPRRPGSLFAALEAAEGERFAAARQTLARWRGRAAERPFSFYSSLLGEDGGRRAIAARLGPEASDAIDEFLRLALAHERDAAPSLQGFLCDFEADEHEVKRDMESGAGAVRVMTVHAAKGLEAPIVFLPDACSAPSPQHEPDIFVLPCGPAGEAAVVWSSRKADDCRAIATAREASRSAGRDEYRRLLYVALTRAEERLYVAGFYGVKKPADDCWAQMIEATLCADRDVETAPAFWNADDAIHVLRAGAAPASAPPPAGESAAPPQAAPDWLFRRVDPQVEPAAPIRPSSALHAADRWRAPAPASAQGLALRRGSLVHLLLQYLPETPQESRDGAARAFLDARAGDLNPATREALVAAALGVIGTPELAALFGPQSRAEVAIAGKVVLPGGGGIEVAGRIDRLGLTEDEALVADFKTGACAAADLPPAYVAQMALYRALLSPLWPGKRIRLLLIFTEGPKIVELGAEALDRALCDVEAAQPADARPEPRECGRALS